MHSRAKRILFFVWAGMNLSLTPFQKPPSKKNSETNQKGKKGKTNPGGG